MQNSKVKVELSVSTLQDIIAANTHDDVDTQATLQNDAIRPYFSPVKIYGFGLLQALKTEELDKVFVSVIDNDVFLSGNAPACDGEIAVGTLDQYTHGDTISIDIDDCVQFAKKLQEEAENQ